MGREYRDVYYPDDSIEVEQKNLDMFFRFMYERHEIWRNRYINKLPQEQWTNDLILKQYKYTNIYRELDRGTIYWIEKIGNLFKNDLIDFKTMLWQTTIYRLCNRIETFEEVGFPDFKYYDYTNLHNSFWEKLHKIEERKEAVMTSAHLTCPTTGGNTKVEGYVTAINDLHKKLDELCLEVKMCKTSKEVFETLRQVHCVGVFIAYEILCDLMLVESIGETDEKGNFIPFKEDDWANVGPGAIEGVRMIFPSTKGKINIYNRMVQLRDEQHKHFERLGIKFNFYEKFTQGHLSLRSIEHSLCEFQKYWLQRLGLGKQRMIFNPNKNRIVDKKRVCVNPDTGDSLIYVNV